jgi:hypothetical protein
VPPSANNFAGIGATDSTQAYNTFRSARIGVRAQIQHLRAYADPGVTRAKLANPLESPRFDLVQPKGKAPTWGHMGGGNWATDPHYSQKILTLYQDLLNHASVSSFADVPPQSFYGPAVAWMEARAITDGVGNTGLYRPATSIARSEVAALLWRMMGRPGRAPHHGFPDVPRGSYYDVAVRYLRAAGITDGVGSSGRFVPTGTVTRAQMVTFLWRLAGTPNPTRRHPFPDVARGTYYDVAVSWAAQHRITDGVGNTGRYQPHTVVTRAQMAAFMWRMMGRPTGYPHHGFPDVPRGSYYDAAVRYLRATGVTDGVGNTGRYGPHQAVTRSEMATFLHRLSGLRAPGQRHPFPDVPRGSYYDRAVSWAFQYRITDGVGNTGRYQPLDPVTRAQMAAFLHRLASRSGAWSNPLPPTRP